MDVPAATVRVLILLRPDVGIATDQAAQVSAPIVGPVLGRLGEPPCPDELIVQGQMRPPRGAALGAGHMLPAAMCEKAVVAARDQLCAVLEGDAVGGLDGRPMGKDLGNRIAAIVALANRAIDVVALANVGQSLCAPVPHKDVCVPI
jgi:hypothetical protein